MSYDPRTIAIFVELLHPPLVHDLRKLHDLHGELFGDVFAFYKNFSVLPGGASFSNPQTAPNMNSLANFLPDRLQLREEFSGATVEDVSTRLERIVELLVARLKVPVFSAQQYVVRTLINPRQYKDSREFLARALFRFGEEDLRTFGRPSHLLGLRLVLPKSEGSPELFSLRVESYNGDPRSLYLENVGTFGPVICAQGLAPFTANLKETYRFLTEEAMEFLARFDRQEEKR